MQRRDFLGLMAAAGAARLLSSMPRRSGPMLDILFGLGDMDGDAERGALMSVEEARRAAEMFGGSIAVGERRPGAILVVIGSAAGPDDALMMNVIDRRAPRSACRRNVFHVVPSGDDLLVWDADLTRFGAETLNKRYGDRFRTEMSSSAWCGWFAVKCVWEAALRSRATDLAALRGFLERPDARFDGHKGVPLYFDGAHQLIQPLYGGTKDEIQPVLERCVWR